MKSNKVFYGWWVAAGLLFVSFFGVIGRFTAGALGPTMMRDTGWSRSDIMLSVTIGLLVYAVAVVFVGRLIDTIGARKVIAVAGGSGIVGFLLFSRATELWHLYVAAGFFLAICTAGTHMVPEQAVTRKWFIKRASLVAGLAAIGYSLSLGVLFPLITRGGVNYGWRPVALVLAVSGVVILLLGRFIIRDTPESVGLRPYGTDEIASNSASGMVAMETAMPASQAVRTVSFWALSLTWGFGLAIQGFMPSLAFWGEAVGASPATAGLFATAFTVPAMVVKPVWGYLGDRFGKRKAGLVGSSACCLIFLAGWLLVKDIPSLIVLCALYGLAYPHLVVITPYTGDLFGRASLGTLTGYGIAIHGFLGALSPILWTRSFDLTGSYNHACFLSAVVYLGVMACWLLARPLKARHTIPLP
ncbi:MAG: MFS transporter [Chloroflexota bacterium]